MNSHQSSHLWSFPLGTWFSTQVRVSFFFPLLILAFCLRYGLELGAALSAVLFASVLLHEFGHIVAARMTGGYGDEILIWPLGGLAFVQPAGTLGSRFMTPAAGPLVNLVLCGVTLPEVLRSDFGHAWWNPFLLPFAEFSPGNLLSEVLILFFTVNYALFLLNLIPAYPLDCGRIVQVALSIRLGNETAVEIQLRIGFIVSILMMFLGLGFDQILVVLLGSIILILNMQEHFQHRIGESYDESFMGYDFSQGYTSLERSEPVQRESRPGFFARWRERRRAEKLRRLQEKEHEAEKQLDALLEKVHLHGIEALTDAEKRLLDRCSARYRDKKTETE